MAFEYAESKDLLEGETKGRILAGVAIALPLRLPLPLPEVPPQRDKAIFFELVE